MYCKRDDVLRALTSFLYPDNQAYLKEITDLVWVASIMSEFSYQANEHTQDVLKERIFALMEERSNILKEARSRFPPPLDFDSIAPYLSGRHELEVGDLAVIANMYHRLVVHEKRTTKNVFRSWYDDAWRFGRQQRLMPLKKGTKRPCTLRPEVFIRLGTELCLRPRSDGLLG